MTIAARAAKTGRDVPPLDPMSEDRQTTPAVEYDRPQRPPRRPFHILVAAAAGMASGVLLSLPLLWAAGKAIDWRYSGPDHARQLIEAATGVLAVLPCAGVGGLAGAFVLIRRR